MAQIFALTGLFSVSGIFSTVSADDTFRKFQNNTAGRYFTVTSDGFEVLELFPAFGRLFASVGQYYSEGNFLYSCYAAELVPVCRNGQDCISNYSETSIDLDVRLFYNMSMAGNYWPGEIQQRMTLFSGDLMLSNCKGCHFPGGTEWPGGPE